MANQTTSPLGLCLCHDLWQSLSSIMPKDRISVYSRVHHILIKGYWSMQTNFLCQKNRAQCCTLIFISIAQTAYCVVVLAIPHTFSAKISRWLTSDTSGKLSRFTPKVGNKFPVLYKVCNWAIFKSYCALV